MHIDHVIRIVAVVAAIFAGWAPLAAEQTLRVLVETGEHPRRDCPITVELPADVLKLSNDWTLSELKDGDRSPHPHQFRRKKLLTWILTGETPAKTLRTFELKPATADSAKEDEPASRMVSVVPDGALDSGDLEIRHRERPVLTYHAAKANPPAGMDAKYARSGHIHPVRTPAGVIVSDQLSPDHPHQDGIFLAYVKTEYQGRQPDFWNLLGGTGRVEHRKFSDQFVGPVCGGFRAQLEHFETLSPDKKSAVLHEEWDVVCWNADDHGQGFRFDITSQIRCATESPLVLKEFHYGGMAFRGAREWPADKARFTTPEGKSREAGNHSRVPWVDLSGSVGDKIAGITVFTDPANFRFPEPVRLHPTMPYFVFTPSVLGDWSIEPKQTHVSRYHYWVHDGEFQPAEAERIWHEIADPPRVAVRVVTE